MSKYMTRQRKLLLEYFQKHPDESLSAGQIVEALSQESISQSAVYRNLASMEQEGKLRRSTKAGSQELFYRYTDAEHCRGQLHLSCVRCGKTMHMEAAEADQLAASLEKNDGFQLNRSDTVLYGLCPKCQS